MDRRTNDLDETIKRTKDAEKELDDLVKQSKGDLERLDEAEDQVVTPVLGETRDRPKEPPDASRPEDLID